MKKNHFLATMKTCLLLSAGVLLASCAQDGFDEQTFTGTYSGYKLTTPDASTIVVKASSDKQSQTITWEAVNGAGTYTVNVFQGDSPDECNNVIAENRVTKVNYITVPRMGKTYYRATIKVNDNLPEENTAPDGITEFKWGTFTIDVATIPEGTDLYAYFKENPIPVSYQGEDITYTLKAGGQYTISDTLNVDGYMFNLITEEDAESRAKVTFVENIEEGTKPHVGFSVGGGLGLKNVDFDCTNLDGPFIQLSKKPVEKPAAVEAWGTKYNFYQVEEPISVISCNVDNLSSFFLSDASFGDNGVWFPTTLLVDDCLVHLTTPVDNNNNAYFYTNNCGGFIKDMTIRNSTFYKTTSTSFKYFVRYGGFGITDAQKGFGWENASLTYENCTFYNVCNNDGWWGNYNGIYRDSNVQWTMTNCIFWNCSTSGSVPRRFLHGRGDRGEKAVFLNNTYMKADGTFQDPQNYDTTGTNIEEDPKFADPTNGDFHISGSKQAQLRTGDPRWLP